MSELGWIGKTVRNCDGRSGKITSEYVGFGHASLHIEVDAGGEAHVQLNTDGPDSGDPGWEWWCENFDGGARYLPLGNQTEAAQSK